MSNEPKNTASKTVPPTVLPIAYRVNDFKDLIGLSRSSIYALISEGKLRSVKIAGRTLIPASEAQRLISDAQSTCCKKLDSAGALQ